LLAILLRTGVPGCSVLDLAHRILDHCEKRMPGHRLSALLDLQSADMKAIAPGIGPAKLCGVFAALQLGQRSAGPKPKRVEVGNPDAVYEFLSPRLSGLAQEEFLVVLLNAKNNVIDVVSITRGTLTASLVHAREVFRPAIQRSAHAIILAHNHPSGDPRPSREDIQITKQLSEAGKQLGIEVLDHLIIGKSGFKSLRKEKLAVWS